MANLRAWGIVIKILILYLIPGNIDLSHILWQEALGDISAPLKIWFIYSFEVKRSVFVKMWTSLLLKCQVMEGNNNLIKLRKNLFTFCLSLTYSL